MSRNKKRENNWGYRPVLKKGKPYQIGTMTGVSEDYLVLEEVYYENDIPIARDGGRAFTVLAEEGIEGMIASLEMAIRHIRERGILIDPWPEQ